MTVVDSLLFVSFVWLSCCCYCCMATKTSHSKHNTDDCRLYLAESKVRPKEWGVFVGNDVKRGMAVSTPELILQWTDYRIDDDDNPIVLDFGRDTGGHYEGRDVASIVPGIGMLAAQSSAVEGEGNVMGFRPTVDEGNLPRTTSPSAGSFTHYYNYTFYATRPLSAGTELIVKSPSSHMYNHNNNKSTTTTTNQKQKMRDYLQSMEYLQQNGYCLDSSLLQMKMSTDDNKNNHNKGRGLVATRYIQSGEVIVVSPVWKLSSHNLTYTIPKKKKKKSSPSSVQQNNNRTQLIMNYCFVNDNNSNNEKDYYFPMAPMVNFMNHDVEHANVQVRWSESANNPPNFFMLEYRATQTILPGQQLFLNYGNEWQQLWDRHVEHWKPSPEEHHYTPAYIMDDVASILRTQTEQSQQPYPYNLQTSCFFHYQTPQSSNLNNKNNNVARTTTIPWNHTRETFYFHNLYPCDILDRTSHSKHHHTYMVRMKNLPYTPKSNKVFPTTHPYVIVSKVPRHAIRFTDKLYSTDQHLPNVFRHPIHIHTNHKHDNNDKDEF